MRLGHDRIGVEDEAIGFTCHRAELSKDSDKASEIEQFLADGSGNVFRGWVGQLKGLQIWTHDIGHAADLGGGPEFIHRRLLRAPGFLQRFDGDIQADFIPELETVGDRFRRAEDPQGSAGKSILLHTEMEGWSGHTHDADRWRGNFGGPGLLANRHPNLAGRLGGEVVEAKRGEEAFDSLGHLIGGLDEGRMFGSGELRRGVKATAEFLKDAFADHTREIVPGNTQSAGVFGAHDLVVPRKANKYLVYVTRTPGTR